MPDKITRSDTLQSVKSTEPIAFRARVEAKFGQLSQAFSAARRPNPIESNDGSYVPPPPALVQAIVEDVKALGFDGVDTLAEVSKLAVTGEPWDDRKYLLEKIVQAASEMPLNTVGSQKISGLLVSQLWNDLQHPPQSYLGSKYVYRSADGSNNSLLYPHLGAANTPYARTCKPLRLQHQSLPDAGVIFDALMARDREEDHPNKISSMLFYMASIIIHDLFRTDHTDFSNSQTSSYLDLSPLYGSNQQEQNFIRTFKDGKVKPDCFSEKRLLGFPPGVAAILIMINRFHNHVVENLATINEGRRFNQPKSDGSIETWKKYDEDLFQTGRLVTCGLYINVILIDYVRTILNLNRTDSSWHLDPRQEIPGGAPMGTGNQVSAEFNLVYRWHSCISTRDSKWTEALYDRMFPGKKYDELDFHELLQGLSAMEKNIPEDPGMRGLADMQGRELPRDKDGKFNDDDLVELLTTSVEDCAGAFGARRIPKILRSVDVLGIEQARRWNLATLNEFRSHFNLKKYTTFEEINPEVANELKSLYDVPDNVELYPGLVCESAKKPMFPGAGLTPPYTTSRVILSDAVALVRGDRFYTVDYTPKHLTGWGFAEASSNAAIDNGCVAYKLFTIAFPYHFAANSIYAHYPFTLPSEMKLILINLKKVLMYDWSHPIRQAPQVMISSYNAATKILNDKERFKVTWSQGMEFLMGSSVKDFMLSGDRPSNVKSRQAMRKALYVDQWASDVKSFYEHKTQQLLSQKAYKLAGFNQIDIIRDLGNVVHVHFCAELFGLPLKTEPLHPRGLFTEKEIYLITAALATCIYYDLEPQQSFYVHQAARGVTQSLGSVIESNVSAIKATGAASATVQAWLNRKEKHPLNQYGVHMIQRLVASGMPVKELVWGQILATAGGIVPTQAQLFAEALEYYLIGDGVHHIPEIARVARFDSPEADERIMRYALEGSRINCGSAAFRQSAIATSVSDVAGANVDIPAGAQVLVNLHAASRDPSVFPDPLAVRLDRPLDAYLQFGHGPHKCLGFDMARIALTAVFKTVFRLKNLRPAKGPQGRISKVPAKNADGYWRYLTEIGDGYFPFPCSLKVNWDD